MRLGTPLRAAATAAVVAMLLGSAGCGGDKPTVKLGGGKPSASPSSSSAQAGPSKPDVPATPRDTTAGRVAFAKYVVAAIAYANGTNDTAPIDGHASQQYGCSECDKFDAFLQGQAKKGLVQHPSTITVKRVLATGKLRTNAWLMTVESTAPASADVDSSGKAHRHYKAHPHLLIDVGISWEHGEYRITGWDTKG